MFKPGDKVVCVDDRWTRRAPGCVNFPVKGPIYTVDRELMGKCLDGSISPGLVLIEVSNPLAISGKPYTFCSSCFRPVTPKKIEDILAVKAPKDSEKWDNRHKIKEKA